MLGAVQQSILPSQGSFLRGGVNYNNLGRFGLASSINILCYHPISSLIDRLENRLQTIEESKKFSRKVIAFSSLTILLNLVQVKILFGARLGIVAYVAVIVTLTALMTLAYIVQLHGEIAYNKTKGVSSPSPRPQEATVNPSLPTSNRGQDVGHVTNPNPPRERNNPGLGPDRNQNSHNRYPPIPTAPRPANPVPNRSVTASSSSNPPLLNHLNTSQGQPLKFSLLPNFQKPIAENILTEDQYRILENTLHCRRETLNFLFTGLSAHRDPVLKAIVFKELRRQAVNFTHLLSLRDFLPEGQNRAGPYLDDNMKKLFDYYIEEFIRYSSKIGRSMRPFSNSNNNPIIPNRFKYWIEGMMRRFPNENQNRLMHRLFNDNDDEVYAACHFADNCAYSSEELREFVRWFIPNPTPEQASTILFLLHQAGRMVQKHQEEPERLGKTPLDPGLKNRVMNFIKSLFKARLYERPVREMTVLEFKEIFSDIVEEYKLLQGKSYRFILAIQP
jgi:hypothetical protein